MLPNDVLTYLFPTGTSEMIPTGTFLFLKMKPGSKKRQKTPTRYSKRQILRGFREKLLKFGPQNCVSIKINSIFDPYFQPKLPRWYSLEHFYFWKWKRILRRDRKRQNNIRNNSFSGDFPKNYWNSSHKIAYPNKFSKCDCKRPFTYNKGPFLPNQNPFFPTTKDLLPIEITTHRIKIAQAKSVFPQPKLTFPPNQNRFSPSKNDFLPNENKHPSIKINFHQTKMRPPSKWKPPSKPTNTMNRIPTKYSGSVKTHHFCAKTSSNYFSQYFKANNIFRISRKPFSPTKNALPPTQIITRKIKITLRPTKIGFPQNKIHLHRAKTIFYQY